MPATPESLAHPPGPASRPVPVSLVLVIDQDDTLAADIDRNVAAVTFDLIEIVLEFDESQRLRRRELGSHVSYPAGQRQPWDGKHSCRRRTISCLKYSKSGRLFWQVASLVSSADLAR